MAGDKFQILIDTKHIGSKEIAKLIRQFEALGGTKTLQAQKALKKLNRDIAALNGGAKKSKPIFGRFAQGIALGNIAANIATKAFGMMKDALSALVGQLKEATIVAAQVEETGRVYQFMGQRAGYAKEELDGYRQTLLNNGIAQKEANQALMRGLQAQLDLNDVVKLGRVAQDAAVIGMTDSSEAHMRIMESVTKLSPRLLKELGIIINLNTVYPKYAKSIGKATAELNEQEKRQAFINAIYEKAIPIQGAYETAMESTSKRMRSLSRHFQDAQVAVGKQFEPVLRLAVDTTEDLLKSITKTFTETDMRKWVLGAVAGLTGLITWLQQVPFVISTGIEALSRWYAFFRTVFESAAENLESFGQLFTDVLSGNYAAAIADAIVFEKTVTDGAVNIKQAFENAIIGTTINLAAMTTQMGVAVAASTEKMREGLDILGEISERTQEVLAIEIPAAAEEAVEGYEALNAAELEILNSTAAIDKQIKKTTGTTKLMTTKMKIEWLGLGRSMEAAFSGATRSIVSKLGFLQNRSKNIFVGMAQDFTRHFIGEILKRVSGFLIPRLLGFLGSIFDTTANDRMAAAQGRDFAKYFIAGMTDSLTRVNLGPQMMGSLAGGTTTHQTMNLNFMGPVTNRDFIAQEILPILEDFSRNSLTDLVIDETEITGARDVT